VSLGSNLHELRWARHFSKSYVFHAGGPSLWSYKSQVQIQNLPDVIVECSHLVRGYDFRGSKEKVCSRTRLSPYEQFG